MAQAIFVTIACILTIAACNADEPTAAAAADAAITARTNDARRDAGGSAMPTAGSSGSASAHKPQPSTDSGTPRDAGTMRDASAPRDASAALDAGSLRDASALTPTGRSEGCGQSAPNGDAADHFMLHPVKVTGVDPAFISAHPANGGSWTDRSYYVRLPADYDPAKAYPLSIGGGGCGNTDGTSGSGGGLAALPPGQKLAIQVGLNYVYPQNAGACFADDFTNTPDLPYFDAVLAQLEADYCVDRGKVFVDGFSSGAWETYMLGCARAGIVRAIGTAAGGLRMTRPPCAQFPIAAILVAGLNDQENPIGPLTPPGKNDSLGSAPARDDILARNGCTGTATAPWDSAYPACVKYTGCPAAYPVVWCAIDAGHGNGGEISAKGFWQFWSSLPDP